MPSELPRRDHRIRSRRRLRGPARSAPSTGRPPSPSPGTPSSSTAASTASGSSPGAAGSATGGASPTRPPPGEHVVIKGSEPVTGWERVERRRVDGRRARTRCSARSTRSPRRSTATGSSTPTQSTPKKHLGDVYLNGTSFYEVASRRRGVGSAAAHRGDRRLDRDGRPDPQPRADPATSGTPRSAPTRRRSGRTSRAPTRTSELVEINVRRSVFYPTEHHLDYITVRGFELAQAASPWAPPTADQPGLIGPNWAKGWIIEDNVIHDAKCSAISIGKEASTGHNYATLRRDKPGYQYQLESVFAARQIGWDREHVGSHIIRRNTIYDCGQNGIVGHLGCVFSTIEDNHIYNIALKREFYGYEIAGIKLHAAIDVDHPPQPHPRLLARHLAGLADPGHPGLAEPLLRQQPRPVRRGQPRPLPRRAQRLRVAGLAGGVQPGRRVRQQPRLRHGLRSNPVLERPTPYHVPHSTQVAGYAAIHGGDDRHIGNIFLGGDAGPGLRTDGTRRPATAGYGTAGYDGHPAVAGGLPRARRPTRPAATTSASWTSSSRSTSATTSTPPGAEPFEAEQGALVLDGSDVTVAVVDEGDEVYLETPAARRVRQRPRRRHHRSRPRTRPLRRRRLRGTRRHPGRPGRRPGRSRQDPDRLLPARPDRRPRLRQLTHPGLVGRRAGEPTRRSAHGEPSVNVRFNQVTVGGRGGNNVVRLPL